jgi:hypothetical protein
VSDITPVPPMLHAPRASNAVHFSMTRDHIVEVFRDWSKRAQVEGWKPSGDPLVDAERSADYFLATLTRHNAVEPQRPPKKRATPLSGGV